MALITDWKSVSNCIFVDEKTKAEVATLACIPVVIQNIVNSLVILAGVVFVFLIIVSGYKFVMSEGDPEKVASARKTFIYALVGFIFILLSFLFLNVIGELTGVDRISPQ